MGLGGNGAQECSATGVAFGLARFVRLRRKEANPARAAWFKDTEGNILALIQYAP